MGFTFYPFNSWIIMREMFSCELKGSCGFHSLSLFILCCSILKYTLNAVRKRAMIQRGYSGDLTRRKDNIKAKIYKYDTEN